MVARQRVTRRANRLAVFAFMRFENEELHFAVFDINPCTYDIAYVWRCIMTSITATEARKRLYKLLDEVAQSHEPVQIAGKRNSAVLIGEDDWRSIQETLYLTSIPGMRESILAGINTSVEDCEKELDW